MGATMLFDSTQIPGEIVDLVAVRAPVISKQPKAIQALLTGWSVQPIHARATRWMRPRGMGKRQQISGEQFLAAQKGLHVRRATRISG
jgi:NitT/TauT family transport system substrate-binding protein